MNPDYDTAKALWRKAWRLAREAEAVPAGTAERAAADAAFSLALGQALEALDHPLAVQRARLTDDCIASVTRVATAQSAILTLPEGSPERDQANAEALAAYVEFGRAMGVELMLEERVVQHVGDLVPEDAAERALYFQAAGARALYDLGGLLPRLMLTLVAGLNTLVEGRTLPLLQPRQLGRGKAKTTEPLSSMHQDIALRILLESCLAGQKGPAWVEASEIGIDERTYRRWLADAGIAEPTIVETLADKLLRQEPLTETERAIHDRLTRRTLQQMITGLAALS